MPVVWASRLLRRPLPERITGADLVPALFAATPTHGRIRVYLLGAGPGVADRAAAKIVSRWPDVEVCGAYSPPFGFEKDAAENEAILARVAAARPTFLLWGSVRQNRNYGFTPHQHQIDASVALCVGATIDFLAAEKKRAPMWMRQSGLEWLHRLSTEPRRLFTRYAKDAWAFPRLVWHEMIGRRVDGH